MMTELKVTGMTCSHCQSAVQRALEAIEGVEAATVDLQTGTARVEGRADPAALVAAIEEEGYQASIAT